MASIATNLISLFTQRGLSSVQSALSTSVERLSSGVRINAAKDDAAGLGISQELQRQTRAYQVATRNTDDAVSMVQTAEGSLQSVGNMLQRLKTLTVQGANESLSKEQRGFIADEIAQLRNEINAVATRTTFNGISLLTGDFSQAVQGEFVKAAQLESAANSVLKTSTIKIGEASDADISGTKSLFSFADVQVDEAAAGTYSLSNDGASITLSRAVGNTVESQTLVLVDGTASSRSEVAFNDDDNGTFVLNFSDLGVTLTVKNDFVAGSDRTAREIATRIVAIGITPNESYAGQGWKAVSGADWATVPSGEDPDTYQLTAVVTSTGGSVRITNSAGLDPVTNYEKTLSAANSVTGLQEIAFTGTAAELNAALATLQVNNETGLGEITVDIVPKGITVYTNPDTGVTSYYRVVNQQLSWADARTYAIDDANKFNGLSGYLVNITSEEENAFLISKLTNNTWFGASDSATYVNLATGLSLTPAQAEGNWYWIDGPEKGTKFFIDGAGGGAATGQVGDQTLTFANWHTNEPNDSGLDEDFGQYYYTQNPGKWNDLQGDITGAVTSFTVEYGGARGVSANTSKTLLLGTPGYINVGDALTLDSVETTGVGAGAADTGVYKMTANASDKTLTLKRFDVDGETLLQSQTISEKDGIGSGRYKTLTFDDLGVSVKVTNSADREVTFGDAESGLTAELTVASSRMASLIGADGPKFQTGVGSRDDLAINVFRDIRLGKNADSQNVTLFNEVNTLINELDESSDPSTEAFQTLENRVENMITVISDMRGDMGAVQNRLVSTRNNITEQFTNLSAAQSQILDTDFASETARLTRMQIGQQASTAMLAQANQLPNVILALLK